MSGYKHKFILLRVKACISAGADGNIVITVDNGKWYQKKVEEAAAAAVLNANGPSTSQVIPRMENPPCLPVVGWKQFPSKSIPYGFCYGSIFNHVVNSGVLQSVGDGISTTLSNFSTDKPMRKGREYFRSGFVSDINDCSSRDFYFVKAHVQASYRQNTYNVTVTLKSPSGDVVDASCECVASAMARCSHIASVLFAIEDYTMEFGCEPVPGTSKLCAWNRGSKTKSPGIAHNKVYNNKQSAKRFMSFDPRISPVDSSRAATFFVSTLPENCMWSTILDIEYEDYQLSANEIDTRRQQCKQFMEGIERSVTSHRPYEVENTLMQASSIEWCNSRWFRVTASNCKLVVNCNTSRGKYNYLRRVVWGLHDFQSDGMQYGIQSEHRAFRDYCSHIIQICEQTAVCQTGLWINPKWPQLGCSPDGIVSMPVSFGGVGLLEIKCPAVIKDCSPQTADKHLTKKQLSSFCCSFTTGVPQLKPSHAYYFQVQMQMAVCDVSWCDFVLWSRKGIHVQRVYRDDSWWQKVLPKLLSFHAEVIVPEVVEMRVPRRLLPLSLYT